MSRYIDADKLLMMSCDEALDTIEHLRGEDVQEVKHRKWAWTETLPDSEGYVTVRYKCSECGRLETKKEPYCNCGAKMDLED